ncbi:hypothetical protein ZWY2020_041956 [Hordeum vulgare]|nr:hypothetical protein ZWY2020_041956 [Hordeum vulgare]
MVINRGEVVFPYSFIIWIERPYEALLFTGIGFGPFLHSLGGRRRRPPSGGPEQSVRYHSGRAREVLKFMPKYSSLLGS